MSETKFRLTVTGIVAIVPSASDEDLTRIIIPNHTQTNKKHRGVPEHYAFLQVATRNVNPDASDRNPHFKFTKFLGDEQCVYLLNSEEVSFETQPTNTKLIKNKKQPKLLKKPSTDEEQQSTVYELQMEWLCPKCPPIAEKYFSIANTDDVAARMDLRGGRESVGGVNALHIWDLPGKKHDQPLAAHVVYEFVIPQETAALLITDSEQNVSRIVLTPDPNGEVEVTLGNGPLIAILELDRLHAGAHSEEHLKLIYDLFEPRPKICPVPKLKSKYYVGYHDNCKPPIIKPQDPRGARRLRAYRR